MMSKPFGTKSSSETKPSSKEELAVAHIRGAILNGGYSSGYRLTVDSISEELRVSFATVREALRRLEGEGLVVSRRNVGATVIDLSVEEVTNLVVVHGVLEAAATAMSARYMTTTDFQELEIICDQFDAAIKDDTIARVSELNREFHAKAVSKCPNEALLDLNRRTTAKVIIGRRALFLPTPARPLVSAAEHRQLLELMRQGVPSKQIEDLVRSHMIVSISEAYGSPEMP